MGARDSTIPRHSFFSPSSFSNRCSTALPTSSSAPGGTLILLFTVERRETLISKYRHTGDDQWCTRHVLVGGGPAENHLHWFAVQNAFAYCTKPIEDDAVFSTIMCDVDMRACTKLLINMTCNYLLLINNHRNKGCTIYQIKITMSILNEDDSAASLFWTSAALKQVLPLSPSTNGNATIHHKMQKTKVGRQRKTAAAGERHPCSIKL